MTADAAFFREEVDPLVLPCGRSSSRRSSPSAVYRSDDVPVEGKCSSEDGAGFEPLVLSPWSSAATAVCSGEVASSDVSSGVGSSDVGPADVASADVASSEVGSGEGAFA